MKFLSTMKKLTVLFLASVLQESICLWFCDGDDKIDPCAIANSTNPFEPEMRSENCRQSTLSDIRLKPGWYNFYAEMLDYPPKRNSCGAGYPYWLNGNISIDENQEEERTVCKVGFTGTCITQVKIKIRNCRTFTAYCLPALEGESERFCFGKNDPTCESNATTKSSTVALTQVMTSESSSIKTTLDEDANGVAVEMVLLIIIPSTSGAVTLLIVTTRILTLKRDKGKKVHASLYDTLNRSNEEERPYKNLNITKEVQVKDKVLNEAKKKLSDNKIHISDEEYYVTIIDSHI